jgi:hypothetical protein
LNNLPINLWDIWAWHQRRRLPTPHPLHLKSVLLRRFMQPYILQGEGPTHQHKNTLASAENHGANKRSKNIIATIAMATRLQQCTTCGEAHQVLTTVVDLHLH